MLKIERIEIAGSKMIVFKYSDGSSNTVDFKSFLGSSSLTNPLKDELYFKQVALYQDGRGIFWPNGLDFCTDFLKNFTQKGSQELQIIEK